MSQHERLISIVGLGYVGLPMAVCFAKRTKVMAFDINPERIEALKKGFDATGEVEKAELENNYLYFTSNAADLQQANFHIVAVPTPIDKANQPNLKPLLAAAKTVGEQLKSGDIVVFESTVYPGVTEDDCVPVLEKYSGLKCGKDFTVGYSPERINPGDKEHSFKKICKVVAGQDQTTLDIVAKVYASVVDAGVYKATSIKVAEAAKVIENTQRDLNIALINELAVIFNKLGIDTQEVLQAAGTKWNFLNFRPGIVGGHCIGVDPYYLTYKANQVGYHPEVILAGRRINDNMAKYIAEQTIKQLINLHGNVRGARIAILGCTFKKDCADIRNSKVFDIYNELTSYGAKVMIHDPLADSKTVKQRYQVDLVSLDDIRQVSAMILAVPHEFYLQQFINHCADRLVDAKLIVDIKGVIDRSQAALSEVNFWRL
ncbi:MAG: nucleotide sugar dehydrogenase [Gammaproteobacteria bacterium]|nr:nucleotide sugar dehydrogenase [Gammaproteobacteria bacterium]